MGFFYAGVWAVVALFLFVMAIKESKLFFLVSGLFGFMSIWWLVNEFVEVNLFEGVYGIVFRVIVGLVLLALLIIYAMKKKGR